MNREPLTHDEIKAIVQRVQAGEDRGDIAARYGVGRSTISTYMRRYGLGQYGRTERGPSRRVDHSWRDYGNCVGLIDFTEWRVKDQIALCNHGCPVRSECLEFGLQEAVGWAKADEGPVYGGLSPRTLSRLQRERKQVAS